MAEKSRREFLKQTGAGALGAGILAKTLLATSSDFSNAPQVDKKRLVAALGDTIIPTAPGYSGYQPLEQYGITDEVLKALPGVSQQDLNVFNASAGEFFGGKSFLDLTVEQRGEFLNLIVASFPADTFGSPAAPDKRLATGKLGTKLDAGTIKTLQTVFRGVRTRVLTVFYRNFPEDHIAREKSGLPLLAPGDQHQIVDPNTKQVVTGWDVANFPGPLSWEEEQERRAKWMTIQWFKD
ncbi:MAG: twin-arginine translocation signal domain-containing protein [Acidobacteria bacterium]|nr:twin-arginine translocation signal domain-containing protein [Acidobacteriota bacterium]